MTSMLVVRHFFVLIGLLSLVPVARSFGNCCRTTKSPIFSSKARRTPANTFTPIHRNYDYNRHGSTTMLTSNNNVSGGWIGSNNRNIINNHLASVGRNQRRISPLLHAFGGSNHRTTRNKRRRNSGSSRRNRGWLPGNVLLGSSSIFRVVWKRILLKIPIKLRKHENGTKNDNNSANTSNEDPLNRVRLFRQLPLRKACIAISIYLAVGVLAYKGLFPEPSWSVLDALYFSCVCLSTIGYGDLVPCTNGGKVFAAIFGMSGILLWSSAIVSVGTRLVQSETTTAETNLKMRRKHALLEFYEQHMPNVLKLKAKESIKPKDPEKEIAEDQSASAVTSEDPSWPALQLPKQETQQETQQEGNQWMELARSLIKPLMVIVSGGTLIGKLEGWNLCDSFYFSFVTAATIGFGDFCPSTRAGRMVATALIPVLLAAAGDFFSRVGVFCIRNRTSKLFGSQAEMAEWLTPEQANEMDLDGNGKVSKSEYVLYMLIEAGVVGPDEVRVLEEQFHRFDVTKSGYIESGDLKAMKKFREKLQRERTKSNSKKVAVN